MRKVEPRAIEVGARLSNERVIRSLALAVRKPLLKFADSRLQSLLPIAMLSTANRMHSANIA